MVEQNKQLDKQKPDRVVYIPYRKNPIVKPTERENMTDKTPLGFFDSDSFDSEAIVASIKERAEELEKSKEESSDNDK